MHRATQLIGLAALMTLLVLPSKGSAVVTALSGGDPADGWLAPTYPAVTPPGALVLAYDLASGSDTTIQGVTFHAFVGDPSPAFAPPGVTVTSSGAFFTQNIGSPFSGTTDDDAMGAMLATQSYNVSNLPIQITISGLPNGQYRVDQFYYATDSGGLESFTINGGSLETLPTNNGAYLVQAVVSISGGSIVLDTTNTTVVTRFNGFAIAQLPEPSSLGLIALGAAALMRRVSRSRAAK